MLQKYGKPLRETARELIMLELYCEGRISSGKAGELIGMSRFSFVQHASQLGIPFFDMTEEEWQAGLEQAKKL